jgi:hypothetical protein
LGDYDPKIIRTLLKRACVGGDPDGCGEPPTAAETFIDVSTIGSLRKNANLVVAPPNNRLEKEFDPLASLASLVLSDRIVRAHNERIDTLTNRGITMKIDKHFVMSPAQRPQALTCSARRSPYWRHLAQRNAMG